MRTVAAAASPLVEARAGAGTGAFLMGPESTEAGDIAQPASRLMARHIPLPGGTGAASDLGDIVALAVAVFGYLMGGLARKAAAFAGAAGGLQAPDPYNPPALVDDTPPPAPAPAWPAPQRPVTIFNGTPPA